VLFSCHLLVCQIVKDLANFFQITDKLIGISGQYDFKDLPLYSLKTKSGAELVLHQS